MPSGVKQSATPLSADQPPALTFGEFLNALFQALDREGVRFCVLRNYEGFPDLNYGHDVDFLIRSADLPRAIIALRSLQGVRIVGVTAHFGGPSIFLEGISTAPGLRALQVDFITCLSWKGMSYLSTNAILTAAIPRLAGNLSFLVPCPAHEAIISLLSSLLVGGWLKEKYFPGVQQTFLSGRDSVISSLSPGFGLRSARRLADAVCSGERQKILSCVRPLRAALTLRALLRKPLRSLWSIVRHYSSEIAIRYSSRSMRAVAFLGLDEGRKDAILESLLPLLQSTAKLVERSSLPQQAHLGVESGARNEYENPPAETPMGLLVSMAAACLWLARAWLNLFTEKKSLTLYLFDNSCHDLSIAPLQHGYHGPAWFARLIVNLLPSPDLWILLDSTTELDSKIQEFAPLGTPSQLEDLRVYVKAKENHAILNADLPIAAAAEIAYAAIIGTLARRADHELTKRFHLSSRFNHRAV
jgi:hypothetical protein